jgi:hypothetical protein
MIIRVHGTGGKSARMPGCVASRVLAEPVLLLCASSHDCPSSTNEFQLVLLFEDQCNASAKISSSFVAQPLPLACVCFFLSLPPRIRCHFSLSSWLALGWRPRHDTEHALASKLQAVLCLRRAVCRFSTSGTAAFDDNIGAHLRVYPIRWERLAELDYGVAVQIYIDSRP